jgi:hypothetical protein
MPTGALTARQIKNTYAPTAISAPKPMPNAAIMTGSLCKLYRMLNVFTGNGVSKSYWPMHSICCPQRFYIDARHRAGCSFTHFYWPKSLGSFKAHCLVIALTMPVQALPVLCFSGHKQNLKVCTVLRYFSDYLINFMHSFWSRNNADISRAIVRKPPLKAFWDDTALPSGVLAPVDLSHGFQVWINADCFAFRSAVQPFAMCMLQ